VSTLALGLTKPLFNGYRGYFTAANWPGLYVDHTPPYRAEIQNECSYVPIHPICLHGVGGDYLSVTCFQAQLQGLNNTCKGIAVYKLL